MEIGELKVEAHPKVRCRVEGTLYSMGADKAQLSIKLVLLGYHKPTLSSRHQLS